MSEILDYDPNRGFVAFPVALFDLDLSPGAFRTLAELCRMANAEGQCWPSLAQIGKKLGRSRASISAYIAELRNTGVLSTEEQKMANGYNYRLRYTISFWKKWRAGLGKTTKSSSKPAQQAERRVQQTERPLRTKNHIHKIQQSPSQESNLISDWQQAVGKAPYPNFASWPTEILMKQSKATIKNAAMPSQLISADISNALKVFATKQGLAEATLCEIERNELKSLIKTKSMLERVILHLEEIWQPHWRKLPNVHQIKRLLSDMPASPGPEAEQKLLKSYLQRWKRYEQSLPSPVIRPNVATAQYPRI
ncbi:MAG: helix-turn-helix domain-containing protein [Sulfitobacter sp.]